VIGSSQNYRIPNEDSLDLEFSDANLFSLNRYPGIDRLEGGARVDYALHAAWYLPSGALLDGLIGQSYRFHKDNVYLPDSGLTDNASDYVAHLIIQPVPLFNLTYRTRLSHDDLGARLIDATANFGTQTLNLSAGYLYSTTNPYTLYDNPVPGPDYFTPRHEVTANLAANFAGYSLAAGAVRNLTTGGFDSANFDVGWQNDCFGINVVYYKRFTSYNLDHGNTTVLLQLTFKTLGTVGFSAL
jgi:LPS-assembly protein